MNVVNRTFCAGGNFKILREVDDKRVNSQIKS